MSTTFNRGATIISMVYIIYTLTNNPLSQEQWDRYLPEIPDLFRKKILKLARWEDRQNSLAGKLLLQYGLKNWSHNIKNLSYNLKYVNKNSETEKIESFIKYVQLSPFGKPFIPNNVFFNISHSGCCCVCAFHSSEIGIDIETIKPIEIKTFFNIFTQQEQDIITNSVTPLHSFYELWTRKEAVIKAEGRGLSTNMKTFCVSKNISVLNGITWYTYPISTAHHYISHIAVKEESPKISVQYISLFS